MLETELEFLVLIFSTLSNFLMKVFIQEQIIFHRLYINFLKTIFRFILPSLLSLAVFYLNYCIAQRILFVQLCLFVTGMR